MNTKNCKLFAAALLLVAGLSAGCSSNKELTESSAHDMVADYSANENYNVPIGDLTRYLTKTTDDYSASGQAGLRETVAKLIEGGFVSETTETLSYPRIEGHFVSPASPNGSHDEYDFEMAPGTNDLSGSHLIYQGSFNPRETITGQVEPDGSVEFHDTTGDGTWEVEHGAYVEDGDVARINVAMLSSFPHYPPFVLTGKASHQKTSVVWHEYHLVPELASKIEGNSAAPYAPGGRIKIGDVSGLHLLNDVEASAQFQWEASLDDFGSIIEGGQTPKGNGEVVFGKKPDGEWVITSITYQ